MYYLFFTLESAYKKKGGEKKGERPLKGLWPGWPDEWLNIDSITLVEGKGKSIARLPI